MLSSCPRTKASPPGLAARNAAYRYDTAPVPQAHRWPAPSGRHHDNQHWNHPEPGMTLPHCTDTAWRLNRDGSPTLPVITQNAQISDLRLNSAGCWLPRHIGGSARVLPDARLSPGVTLTIGIAGESASVQRRLDWSARGHGSLVQVLAEAASSGGTGASCWSWHTICRMSVRPVHAAAERALHKAFTTAVARRALSRCRPDPAPSHGGHRSGKSRLVHVRYLR